MKISVRNLTGHEYTLEVHPKDTLETVKVKVSETLRAADKNNLYEQIDLFHKNTALPDTSTLESLGITDNSILYIFTKEPKARLCCSSCKHQVALAKDLRRITSDKSEKQKTEVLYGAAGVIIYTFRNPNNCCFDVVTVTEATATKVSQATLEHTWFPGYSWIIVQCPGCGSHLGWYFQAAGSLPTEADDKGQTFYGLVKTSLTSTEN